MTVLQTKSRDLPNRMKNASRLLVLATCSMHIAGTSDYETGDLSRNWVVILHVQRHSQENCLLGALLWEQLLDGALKIHQYPPESSSEGV